MENVSLSQFSHVRDGALIEAKVNTHGTPTVEIAIGEYGDIIMHLYGDTPFEFLDALQNAVDTYLGIVRDKQPEEGPDTTSAASASEQE